MRTRTIEDWELPALWARKAAGCAAARERLIERYRHLVPKTRQRIIPSVPIRIQADDLDSTGCLALIKAVDQFDPARKIKFESYAISLIRGSLLEFLRRDDWAPRSVRTKQKAVNAAVAAVEARYGPQGVTDERCAAAAGLTLDLWFQLYAEADVLQVGSLEDVIGDSEHDDLDPLVVAESVSSQEPDPRDLAVEATEREALHRCLGWLPVQERAVMDLYYFDGLTLKQAARVIDRSESRAHQLHAQAIQRLRGFAEGVCCAA